MISRWLLTLFVRQSGAVRGTAVKIQTYTADTMTIDSNQEWFKIHGTIWNGENLYHLYQKAYTPWEWHEEIFHVAKEEGLVCFSTPFDKSAVDFLETLDNPIYKIASFEDYRYRIDKICHLKVSL